jgi:spermidine synthase
MAIELGASRLLAPYFSSSQIIWTIIIGTIMIATALGNLWGGRKADKDPDPKRLYGRLIFVAIWTAAIPLVGKYVITGISVVLALFVKHNFLVWASLLSCLILFVVPLLLLGTVTPSLAKYTMNDLDNNAKVIGKLGALNTIGCIIGTFLPTFVTIPAVGTAATFYIFAGILAVLALCFFISKGGKAVIKPIVAVVIIAGCSFTSTNYSFAFWERDLNYEGESIYNYLQVKENDDSVILSTNVLFGVQSIMKKDKELTGMYYDYALAAPLMAGVSEDSASDILILGLGSGTYATMCERYFPNATIEGVEIDGDIVKLAEEYFDLSDRVKITVHDGRAYLAGTTGDTGAEVGKYDVIMVDAYQDITIPFQMSTVEMFSLVRDHLKENGVMVVNLNMRSNQADSINDYLVDTIASVFPSVYTAKVKNNTNMELFASMDDNMLTNLAKWQAEQERVGAAGSDIADMMRVVSENLIARKGGDLILTDDKAPVELLGMKVMDEIIQDELAYYRDIFKTGNLSDILDMLG